MNDVLSSFLGLYERHMTLPNDLDKHDHLTLRKMGLDILAKADEKRANEIKTLVNGWKLKAEQQGIAINELIAEMQTYLPADHSSDAKTRAPRGSVVKDEKAYVKGVTYKNPSGSETWIGGTKGPRPPWLRDQVPDSLSQDAKVKKFQALAAK